MYYTLTYKRARYIVCGVPWWQTLSSSCGPKQLAELPRALTSSLSCVLLRSIRCCRCPARLCFSILRLLASAIVLLRLPSLSPPYGVFARLRITPPKNCFPRSPTPRRCRFLRGSFAACQVLQNTAQILRKRRGPCALHGVFCGVSLLASKIWQWRLKRFSDFVFVFFSVLLYRRSLEKNKNTCRGLKTRPVTQKKSVFSCWRDHDSSFSSDQKRWDTTMRRRAADIYAAKNQYEK